MQKTLSSIAETSNKLGAFVDQTNEDLNLKELSTELTDTLNQLTAIAGEAKTVLKADSEFRHQITLTLNEIVTAARAVRILAELLERNPNAIYLASQPIHENFPACFCPSSPCRVCKPTTCTG